MTVPAERLASILRSLGACGPARRWLGERDLETAWNECARGDWLLWAASNVGVDRRQIVRAAADCAETALRYVPEGDTRPQKAIAVARAWADDPTEETCEQARRVAVAAAAAAYATVVSDDAARRKAYARCADLVRERISYAELLAAVLAYEEAQRGVEPTGGA